MIALSLRPRTPADNLHVATEARSTGIGPRLLDAAAHGMTARGWKRSVHLWVYDANVRARAFYARMGGTEVETCIAPTPDGGMASERRVAWSDCTMLQRNAGAPSATMSTGAG